MKTYTSSNTLHDLTRYGGEMGRLISEKDWSKTTLGIYENWPQSLKTSLSIILHSKFPMFIWWGPELICFYNDAYRPSLGQNGKHPSILGMPAEESWAEIWETIKPLIDDVLTGSKSVWQEDQLIPIYRNGKLEDVYWTFSYSAVTDETNQPQGVLVTCIETTDKVISRRMLEESKSQLEFAIEAAELGTWDYNPFTNKFSGNSRLKSWFGLPDEAQIDLNAALDVMAEKDRPRVTRAIQHSLEYGSGGKYDIEYVIINPKNKTEIIVRAKGKAWFNEEGVCYRFNGTLQDVTEQKEIEKMKDDFISMASHEFKTPVTTIKAYSQIAEHMLAAKQDNDTAAIINKMGKQVDRLTVLMNDLLDISKIQKGKLDYKEDDFDISDLLQDTIDDIQKISPFHRIINNPVDKVNIYGDKDKICQVFNNILSNAIKYSPKANKVVVTSEVKDQIIQISVQDFGIGMDKIEHAKVFEQFYRVNSSYQSTFPGMGIGLYICNEIINRHKGEINIQSSRGNGTTITIQLPLDHRKL